MLRLHSARGRGGLGANGAERAEIVLEIGPMRRRDLKNVIAIERRIFPSPWSIGLYMSEIAQPATRAYYVASVSSELVGYAGMMVVVGEAHVTNIGVAPEWQRHGVGRRLLLQLAQVASEFQMRRPRRARGGGAECLTQRVGQPRNRVDARTVPGHGFEERKVFDLLIDVAAS